jgi:hypothetical protein
LLEIFDFLNKERVLWVLRNKLVTIICRAKTMFHVIASN